MEVADAADHRRRGDKVIAILQEFFQKGDILRVAFDQPVLRIVIKRAFQPSVL